MSCFEQGFPQTAQVMSDLPTLFLRRVVYTNIIVPPICPSCVQAIAPYALKMQQIAPCHAVEQKCSKCHTHDLKSESGEREKLRWMQSGIRKGYPAEKNWEIIHGADGCESLDKFRGDLINHHISLRF